MGGKHKAGEPVFVLGALLPNGNKGNVTSAFKGMVRCLRISTFVRYDGDFSPPSQLGSDAAGVAAFNFGDGHGDRLRGVSGTKANGEIHGAQWVKLGDADARL